MPKEVEAEAEEGKEKALGKVRERKMGKKIQGVMKQLQQPRNKNPNPNPPLVLEAVPLLLFLLLFPLLRQMPNLNSITIFVKHVGGEISKK